ncbi:MAG: CDP-alcohol phosphatidyltransferase family protein [Myxococcales bacterium]|nr:CDP-alcohol phosphatidyltransferase family protein [Myxococcales bacterium]
MVWLLRPVERALTAARVTPTQVTVLSLVLCVLAAIAIGSEYLATGAWLFIAGGMLDILDGRLARATSQESPAGALFDSIADRWSELAIFTGLAWYLRDGGVWLLAAILACGGSFMVSYTRARSEAVGLELRGGAMQRAERIVLISVGALVAAWFAADDGTAVHAHDVLGLALAVCGVLSCVTAIGRWSAAHRALMRAAEAPKPIEPATTVAKKSALAKKRDANHHGLGPVH